MRKFIMLLCLCILPILASCGKYFDMQIISTGNKLTLFVEKDNAAKYSVGETITLEAADDRDFPSEDISWKFSNYGLLFNKDSNEVFTSFGGSKHNKFYRRAKIIDIR